jgi:hypothetical protein
MNNRLKIFGIIALLGFMAGILAQVTAVYLVPAIIAALPLLAGVSSFLVSGVAGAVITVAIVGAWAYMTGKKEPY